MEKALWDPTKDVEEFIAKAQQKDESEYRLLLEPMRFIAIVLISSTSFMHWSNAH